MKQLRKYFILLLLPVIVSCGFTYKDHMTGERVRNKDAYVSLPFGIKKAKRKIRPTGEFNDAIKAFRIQKNYFPEDLYQLTFFSSKSKSAVEGMKAMGFNNLYIAFVSADSLVINFEDKLLYTQHIGLYDTFSKYASGSFIYTYKNNSFVVLTIVK